MISFDGYMDIAEETQFSSIQSQIMSYQQLTEEQKVFIATIAGESIGQGSVAWEAVSNTVINRIGVYDWARYKTAFEVIKNTGYEGYGSREYVKAMEYLSKRSGDNQLYESLISTVMPIYDRKVGDITEGAQLFYSPNKMSDGERPSWNFSLLEEVRIDGIDPNDFRFFRYK